MRKLYFVVIFCKGTHDFQGETTFFSTSGFDTRASTMTYLTFNLAKISQRAKKLVEEVDAYLVRHGGKATHVT